MSKQKFIKMLREAFNQEMEDIDRVKRNRENYGDEESWDDYHDVSDDVDRLRRSEDNYGETEFEEDNECPYDEDVAIISSDETIPDVLNSFRNDEEECEDFEEDESVNMPPLTSMSEVSPPGKEAENWIRKNKDNFKKQYGDRWEKVLYSTAHKLFGK